MKSAHQRLERQYGVTYSGGCFSDGRIPSYATIAAAVRPYRPRCTCLTGGGSR